MNPLLKMTLARRRTVRWLGARQAPFGWFPIEHARQRKWLLENELIEQVPNLQNGLVRYRVTEKGRAAYEELSA